MLLYASPHLCIYLYLTELSIMYMVLLPIFYLSLRDPLNSLSLSSRALVL